MGGERSRDGLGHFSHQIYLKYFPYCQDASFEMLKLVKYMSDSWNFQFQPSYWKPNEYTNQGDQKYYDIRKQRKSKTQWSKPPTRTNKVTDI